MWGLYSGQKPDIVACSRLMGEGLGLPPWRAIYTVLVRHTQSGQGLLNAWCSH